MFMCNIYAKSAATQHLCIVPGLKKTFFKKQNGNVLIQLESTCNNANSTCILAKQHM